MTTQSTTPITCPNCKQAERDAYALHRPSRSKPGVQGAHIGETLPHTCIDPAHCDCPSYFCRAAEQTTRA